MRCGSSEARSPIEEQVHRTVTDSESVDLRPALLLAMAVGVMSFVRYVGLCSNNGHKSSSLMLVVIFNFK